MTVEDAGLAVDEGRPGGRPSGRPGGLPVGERELLDALGAITVRMDRLVSMFEEFLPALRAYFDPNQGGARGFAIRRAMTKTEGRRGD